jgi:anti-sigma regulatory factor (Ser/Thr protein kinase)
MTTAAFAMSDASKVGAARRHALSLAEALDFPQNRAGQVGIVVSELGTNLVKHARDGTILIRALYDDSAGIEIISVDRGPGMTTSDALRDGHSTAGSLGHGLGAANRLSDQFEVYSRPDGSVIVSRVWSMAPGRAKDTVRLSAVSVPHPNEPVCGDAWSRRVDGEVETILVADGLGHGLHAHEAAEEAVRTLAKDGARSADAWIESIHHALTHTRGAAVAVAQIDCRRGVVTFSGLGNVAGAVISPAGTRHGLISVNGTAGHVLRHTRSDAQPIDVGSSLFLHTDGISTTRQIPAGPGVWTADPAVAAAFLYRDGVRGHDDATVVVARRVS